MTTGSIVGAVAEQQRTHEIPAPIRGQDRLGDLRPVGRPAPRSFEELRPHLLDGDQVRGIHATLLPLDDGIRRPGTFGPKVEPPAGADKQTAFLSFLGRSV